MQQAYVHMYTRSEFSFSHTKMTYHINCVVPNSTKWTQTRTPMAESSNKYLQMLMKVKNTNCTSNFASLRVYA